MDTLVRKKLLISVLPVVIALLASSALMDKGLNSLPYARTKHQQAVTYLDDWTAKSLVTFGVSKTINVALSVIEDSEVQATVFGTGANVAIGEAVRPLNDTVDKVASVAMASAISLGIQRTLMEIGARVGLTWFLTASMVCWLLVIWLDSSALRRLAAGLLVLALVARFGIPVAVLATGYAGDQFMQGAYTESQQQLTQLKAQAQKDASFLETACGSEDENIIERAIAAPGRIGKWVSGLGDRWAKRASAYSRVAVAYIVVFIVQTMLMPLLILWGLIKLLGHLFSPAAAAEVEARLLDSVRVHSKPRERVVQAAELAAEGEG